MRSQQRLNLPHEGWSPVTLQSCPKLGQGAGLDFVPPHQPVFGWRLASEGSEIFTESALSSPGQSRGESQQLAQRAFLTAGICSLVLNGNLGNPAQHPLPGGESSGL